MNSTPITTLRRFLVALKFTLFCNYVKIRSLASGNTTFHRTDLVLLRVPSVYKSLIISQEIFTKPQI